LAASLSLLRRIALAALAGSASGCLTIALDALGATYLERAAQIGVDPALPYRVALRHLV
jgi:hypothetical protein